MRGEVSTDSRKVPGSLNYYEAIYSCAGKINFHSIELCRNLSICIVNQYYQIVSRKLTLNNHACLSPTGSVEARQVYATRLTDFEDSEIVDYPEIWYVNASGKVNGVAGAAQNNGYDDEHGSYIKVSVEIPG